MCSFLRFTARLGCARGSGFAENTHQTQARIIVVVLALAARNKEINFGVVLSMKKTSDEICLGLFRVVVSDQAGGRCEICGAQEGVPHHIHGRDNKAVRYDPTNGIWLCNHHHRWAEKLGTKKFIEYLLENDIRLPEWEKELIIRKNAIVKANNQFRAEWKARLLDHLREVA